MKLAGLLLSVTLSFGFGLLNGAQAETKAFLNVSYDVMRDFYKDYNPLFLKEYAAKHHGETLNIQQSHGGSSKQALSVANGLQADVVTMNQNSDIDLLVTKGLVRKNWESVFPDQAIPFTSVSVILVRKGNPKNIHDWEDLTKDGVQVVVANPKTTGNGRYSFLAVYGAALKANNNNKDKALEIARAFLKNVSIRDNGGRAATTSFVQRQIGDALITFENEAQMAAKQFGAGQFEVIYPKYSIKGENPVAIVDTVADHKGSKAIAKEYLDYLWSEPAQELAASLYLRPSNSTILQKYAERFPELVTFRANDVFGSWPDIMKTIFADGGLYDQADQQ